MPYSCHSGAGISGWVMQHIAPGICVARGFSLLCMQLLLHQVICRRHRSHPPGGGHRLKEKVYIKMQLQDLVALGKLMRPRLK